jgi:hypothetical protein
LIEIKYLKPFEDPDELDKYYDWLENTPEGHEFNKFLDGLQEHWDKLNEEIKNRPPKKRKILTVHKGKKNK